MSLTSLASSFADTYVNAPAARARSVGPPPAISVAKLGAAGAAAAATGGPGGPGSGLIAAGGGGAGGAGGSTVGDNLKALTDYIPSEILTLYIAAIAAIGKWGFVGPNGQPIAAADLPAMQDAWYHWLFIGCMLAAPLWVLVGVFLSSKSTPSWKAFAWPVLAAPIAFYVYALAIPNSWITGHFLNGGLLATLALLIITPLLHTGTLIYTKLFPPS